MMPSISRGEFNFLRLFELFDNMRLRNDPVPCVELDVVGLSGFREMIALQNSTKPDEYTGAITLLDILKLQCKVRPTELVTDMMLVRLFTY